MLFIAPECKPVKMVVNWVKFG